MKEKTKENTDPMKMEEKELPKVTAFQDEFTRKFMVSTKEEKDGFYRFKSGVDGYTMLFPENAKLSEKMYSVEKNKSFESIDISSEDSKENSFYFIKLIYQKEHDSNAVDLNLERLKGSTNYKGDFEEKDLGDKTIYYGSSQTKSKESDQLHYRYFSYIKSNKSNESIDIRYNAACSRPKNSCKIDPVEQERLARKIMESIKFTRD